MASVFDEKVLCELVRQRLGEVDASREARVIWSIPQSLNRLAHSVAKNPQKRHLLLTPRETTVVDLAAGVLDLEGKRLDGTLPDLMTEYIESGSLWYAPIYSLDFLGSAISDTAKAVGYLTVSVPTTFATGSLTISQGARAVGQIRVTGSISIGATLVLNGLETYTFVADSYSITPNQIKVKNNFNDQAAEIAAVLTASNRTYAKKCTWERLGTVINISSKVYGTVDNGFFMSVPAGMQPTGSPYYLSGGAYGVQHGEVFAVNGRRCVWQEGSSDDILYIGEPEDDAADNAINLANALSNDHDVETTQATYSPKDNVLEITYKIAGAIGNFFSLTNSDLGHVTRSNPTLTGGMGGIVEGETITIYGVPFTFSNFHPGDTSYLQFSQEESAQESADLITEALNAFGSGNIFTATYVVGDDDSHRTIIITYKTAGVGGNSYTLNDSSGQGVTRSAPTLTGGYGTDPTAINIGVNNFAEADMVHWRTDGSFPTTTPIQINANTQLYVFPISATKIALSTSDDPADIISFTDPGSISTTHTLYGPADARDVYPLQPIPNRDFVDMDQTLGAEYRYYWLDNNLLRVKGLTTETSPIDGFIYFECPFQPSMADFAASQTGYKLSELHDDLVEEVIKVVTGPGRDAEQEDDE